MKTLLGQAGHFRSTGSKIAMAFAFVSAMYIWQISPAFAEHGNEHGRGNWRGGEHHYRESHGNYHEGYYRYRPSYHYPQPVYIPPPVYYPLQQPPGISLFLPFNLHR